MNDDENKPADNDAPRGMSDQLVDGDTFDITDDPAKEEEKPFYFAAGTSTGVRTGVDQGSGGQRHSRSALASLG